MGDKGETEKENTTHSSHVDILERGEVFFFYRPKVEMEHAKSIDDVQRMYMVIKPEKAKAEVETKQSHNSGKESFKTEEHDGDSDRKPSSEEHKEGKNAKDVSSANKEESKKDNHDKSMEAKKQEKKRHGGEGEEKVNISKQDMYRLIILGRKSLPDPSKRTRPYWSYVDLVTTNMEDIKKALGPDEYETATRGTRHNPAARAAGEGVYCIVKHDKGNKSHTHLAYKLELPKAESPSSPQSELNIQEEGSFIIQVKNPNQSTPPNVGLGNKRRATYPAHLQSNMGHYRYVSADPCDYLNYEGCEFLLISASDDLEKELDIHLDVVHDEGCSALLSLLGKNSPLNVKPLLEGEWA